MSRPESVFWSYLRSKMGNMWDAARHEDWRSPGIPDVSFAVNVRDGRGVDGWIELKVLERWPVRPGTSVNIDLRPDQKNWLRARGRRGSGLCFVLLRVGKDEFYLFHYKNLPEVELRDKLVERAVWSCRGTLDPVTFLNELIGGRHDN